MIDYKTKNKEDSNLSKRSSENLKGKSFRARWKTRWMNFIVRLRPKCISESESLVEKVPSPTPRSQKKLKSTRNSKRSKKRKECAFPLQKPVSRIFPPVQYISNAEQSTIGKNGEVKESYDDESTPLFYGNSGKKKSFTDVDQLLGDVSTRPAQKLSLDEQNFKKKEVSTPFKKAFLSSFFDNKSEYLSQSSINLDSLIILLDNMRVSRMSFSEVDQRKIPTVVSFKRPEEFPEKRSDGGSKKMALDNDEEYDDNNEEQIQIIQGQDLPQGMELLLQEEAFNNDLIELVNISLRPSTDCLNIVSSDINIENSDDDFGVEPSSSSVEELCRIAKRLRVMEEAIFKARAIAINEKDIFLFETSKNSEESSIKPNYGPEDLGEALIIEDNYIALNSPQDEYYKADQDKKQNGISQNNFNSSQCVNVSQKSYSDAEILPLNVIVGDANLLKKKEVSDNFLNDKISQHNFSEQLAVVEDEASKSQAQAVLEVFNKKEGNYLHSLNLQKDCCSGEHFDQSKEQVISAVLLTDQVKDQETETEDVLKGESFRREQEILCRRAKSIPEHLGSEQQLETQKESNPSGLERNNKSQDCIKSTEETSFVEMKDKTGLIIVNEMVEETSLPLSIIQF